MLRSSQVASVSLTRPSDTTAYASGDLVANSTTAGSVTLLSWSLPEGGLWLRRLRLSSTNTSVTNASFRLWLTTDSAITFSNGDNGALAIGSSTLAIGDVLAVIDINLDVALTGSGAIGTATFDEGLVSLYGSTNANGRATLYGFLEARAAYTPASGEVFTISIRGDVI